jgi:Uma2 family endonuclease
MEAEVVMAVPMVKRLLTVDEYERLAEEGFLVQRVELIHGEIIESTARGHRRRLLTIDEYHQMVEAGILSEDERVELIQGEMVEMTPIGSRHIACLVNLITLFARLIPRVQLSPQSSLQLGEPHTELQPDLVLLQPRDDLATNPPKAADALLVIEIAETSLMYDRDVKVPLYAKSGIPEVWLIDLNSGSISSYRRPSSSGYLETLRYRRGDTISPEAFPDEGFPVDEILA